MKQICFVTSNRAEYGLLKHLMKYFFNEKKLKMQIIVTGSHLSKKHGLTVEEIVKDQFFINKKIKINLDIDSKHSSCKALGELIQKFSKSLTELNPDIIILLGDRFELLGLASAALIHSIPIAHIHGGEITEGAFDDSIRHAITKLSSIHFVSTEVYRKRIIQLGENPSKIFNVGGMGVDAINKVVLLDKKTLQKELGVSLMQKNILITYHPVTNISKEESNKEFLEIIKAVSKLKDTLQIFTMPNFDPGNIFIREKIKEYANNNHNVFFFESLGQIKYYTCLSLFDALIGNSSSGLLEAPSFNIATINIGNRQKGRLRSNSVIDVDANNKKIYKSILSIYSKSFKEKIKNNKNPYGNGNASKKIFSILKKIELKDLKKKPFFDVNFS